MRNVIMILIIWMGGFSIVSANPKFKKGYIVMFPNDTIYGYVDYRNWDINPKEIQFKKEGDNKVQSLSPLRCKSFQVENEIYEGHIVEIENSSSDVNHLSPTRKPQMIKDTVFLSLFLRGKANLYYLKDEIGKQHFLIKHESDSIVELIYKKYYMVDGQNTSIPNQSAVDSYTQTVYSSAENNLYKGQLIAILKDESLSSLITKARYCSSDLIRIIEKYNETKDGKNKIFRNNYKLEFVPYAVVRLTNISLDFQIVGGNTLGYISNLNKENTSCLCPIIGLEVFFPRTEKKFSIVSELEYLSYQINPSITFANHDQQFSISEKYIKSTNLLRFAFTNFKIRPFINAGICFAYQFKEDIHISTDSNSQDPVLRQSREFHNKGSFEHILVTGCGIKYKRLIFELRKENLTPPIYLPTVEVHRNAFSLIAGFSF